MLPRRVVLAPLLAMSLASCADSVAGTSETDARGTSDGGDTTGASEGSVDGSEGSTTAAPATDATSEVTSEGTSDSESTGEATTGATTGAELCDDPAPLCATPTCADGVWTCPCAQPLEASAGYVELEPVDYELGLGDEATPMQSSAARMFYTFFPADEDACGRPLAVLFNGGPGVSSAMLWTTNTGPRAVSGWGQAAAVIDNPARWTKIANLLYVDARQTGFSYSALDDPSDAAARSEHFTLRNFNPYLDAADFVRVILRFLDARPQLQRNPIMLVGESYGGTRATVALNLLLLSGAYAAPGRYYRDPALVDEIDEHFAAAFPGEPGASTELARQQFGRQVLIQPLVTGSLQQFAAGDLLDLPGSPVWQLAEALDLTFTPCSQQGPACNPLTNARQFVESSAHRSIYDLDAAYGWLDKLLDRTRDTMLDHGALEALLVTTAPADIAGLPAAARDGAFRVKPGHWFPLDADVGDLPDQLGALAGEWDRYFIAYNSGAGQPFSSGEATILDVRYDSPHTGALFLENLVHVETLITSSPRDIAIYSPGIPEGLKLHGGLVADVVVDADAPEGEPRPGEFVVHYSDIVVAGVDAPGARVVRFPTYDASHAITLDQSPELREDIASWLADG